MYRRTEKKTRIDRICARMRAGKAALQQQHAAELGPRPASAALQGDTMNDKQKSTTPGVATDPQGRLEAIVSTLNSGEYDAYDAAILPLQVAQKHWQDKAGLRRFCEAVIEAHRQVMDEC